MKHRDVHVANGPNRAVHEWLRWWRRTVPGVGSQEADAGARRGGDRSRAPTPAGRAAVGRAGRAVSGVRVRRASHSRAREAVVNVGERPVNNRAYAAVVDVELG